MNRKLCVILIYIISSFCSIYSYDLANPNLTFDFVFTKSGENEIEFCTYDTAKDLTPALLEGDLSFGVLEKDDPHEFPLKVRFGVYWDYYADKEPVSPDIQLEFSSSRIGTTESCMMMNTDGGALNFNIKADIFDRENNEVVISSSEVIIEGASEIYSTSLSPSKRIITLYSSENALKPFEGIRQGAQIELSLAPPKDENGNYTEFVGTANSYEGYIIIRMNNQA